MAVEQTSTTPIRVGDWIVDPAGLRLIGPPGYRKLRPRDLAVLDVLARHAPAAVDLEQIRAEAWGHAHVVDQAITNAISHLRAAFDDSAATPKVIAREGKGYRLIVPVQRGLSELPAPAGGCPYKGLAPYALEDASLFVGRSRVIDEISAALEFRRAHGLAFLLLLGASGAGKTSLVQAGVLPRLLAAAGQANGERLRHGVIDCNSDNAFRDLALALSHACLSPAIEAHDDVDALADRLLRDPEHAAAALAARVRGNALHLMLFLDSLEALFRGALARERRESFFQLIDCLARSGRVTVLAAMRSDDFPLIETSAHLIALTRDRGQYHVRPPDRAELRAIICQPASLAGIEFETARDGSSLIDHIVEDAQLDRDALPLLSLLLAKLYERRTDAGLLTFAAYEAMGRLAGCCADHAERVYAQLSAEQQLAFPGVLVALARIVDARASRRHRPRRDFTAAAQHAVIDAFVEARLFATWFDGKNVVVSVAHDAVFRIWPRAIGVIDEYRQQIQSWNNLTAALAQWEESNRSDAYCLSPGPLQEVASLRSVPGVELSERELSFIAASARRQRRLQTARRAGVAALIALTIVTGTAAFLFYVERNNALLAQQASEQATAMMVDIFQWSDPLAARYREAGARDLLDAAYVKLQSQPLPRLVEARMADAMGMAYMNLGQFDRAGSLLQRALELWTLERGPASLDVARAHDTLGKLDYYRGRYDDALQRYERALVLFESHAGASESFAQLLGDLAELKVMKGAYAESLALYERALAMRKAVLGPGHYKVGETLGNMGGVHRAAGNPKDAERLYRESIAIQAAVFGNKHPNIATVHNNLALLLMEAGRLEEARTLHQQALAIRREIYGELHPQTANSLVNLGALLVKLGELNSAEDLLQRSLEAHLKLFGPTHIAVAFSRNNLGLLRLARGEPDAAAAMFRLATQDFSAAHGPKHPNVGLALVGLARALTLQKKYAEAEEAALRAVRVLEATVAADHWRLAVAKTVYAAALSGQGRGFDEQALLIKPYAAIVAAQGVGSEAAQQALERARAHFLRTGNRRALDQLQAIGAGPNTDGGRP
ncbi:MAG TPA: tetratricopeptide repeat protein [Burkholderiaceae bacterium]|nr:tetratricopeptide repeat protein [Burkholderiaceae bacterium]